MHSGALLVAFIFKKRDIIRGRSASLAKSVSVRLLAFLGVGFFFF